MTPIPLSAPDGQVYAYACGVCHQVRIGAEMARARLSGPIADLVEWSMESASECCACRRCGVGPIDDYECSDCSRDWRAALMWSRISLCMQGGIASAEQLDEFLDRVNDADDDEVIP